MIPGSLGEDEVSLADMFNGIAASWRRLRKTIRRYFWLWIAYQITKGSLTLTLIWIPVWWRLRG